jgi:PST family polysaccharide transporter
VGIKHKMISGILWTAIAKYSGIVISLLISAILARLLTPEVFGIVAIAFVITSFFSIFSDLGIGPAIIQNRTLTKKDISNIYLFTVLSGFLLGALFFVSSWGIAKYYQDELLITICQILSVNLFFATTEQVQLLNS